MKSRDYYANIPPLNIKDTEVHDNADKARIFLESFFPRMDEPKDEPEGVLKEELG